LIINHDGRTYDLGTGYGHIAIGVDDLDATLTALAGQGISRRTSSAKAGRGSASSRTRIVSF
jgi:hypothetical protein